MLICTEDGPVLSPEVWQSPWGVSSETSHGFMTYSPMMNKTKGVCGFGLGFLVRLFLLCGGPHSPLPTWTPSLEWQCWH